MQVEVFGFYPHHDLPLAQNHFRDIPEFEEEPNASFVEIQSP